MNNIILLLIKKIKSSIKYKKIDYFIYFFTSINKMNYTNSTLTVEDNNSKKISESVFALIALIILCIVYFCFCTPNKQESEKRFKWGVERAKARIELRNELAQRV
tara:strand:+ start:34 stop:348 length:315 start_codon:yes stop_codon:yes gene_type:complete